MRVLVVGGAGYIGSVTTQFLLREGHEVVIFDNMTRGHKQAVPPEAQLLLGDMGSEQDLVFAFEQGIDAVMHFAALSLVGESVENPALYFKNNVANGLTLLDSMLAYNVKHFIFSSTCAVYGEPESSPITENLPLSPANPYGESKLAFEKVLKWYSAAYGLKYVSLRYFNAAGASGAAGEDHNPESHLIPLVLQVASGKRDKVTIYGDDYATPDGTCVRDYIHVKDLAAAHLKALNHLVEKGENAIFNLGNGTGASVKEVIDVARQVTGKPIPSVVGARRVGDPPFLVASNEKIHRQLGWRPQCSDLKTIISDAWEWHQNHPEGYSIELEKQR